MKVLLFGVLADVVGESFIEIDMVNDVETMKENILSKFPLLNNYNFMIAVNKEKVETNISLNAGDEIALLPPFAGG
jgi:molybdopterin converting factor small subunit